jgi:S-adenosylmethionine:tRNA-ribosyltransferase-isomerase (queuine synthetase)
MQTKPVNNVDTHVENDLKTFSLFSDFYEFIPAFRDSTIDNVYSIVSSGTFKVANDVRILTAKLRAETNTTIQDKIKKEHPFLIQSARYDEAAKSKDKYFKIKDENGKTITSDQVALVHSGYLCLDFDHLDTTQYDVLRADLVADPNTLLLFRSPRGQGIKRIVAVAGITVDNHEAVYYALMLHHWHVNNMAADESCTNVNRGTFLPHDPQCYYNVTATRYQAEDLLSTYQDAIAKMKFVIQAIKQAKKDGNEPDLPANILTWQLPVKTPKKTRNSLTTGTLQAKGSTVPATRKTALTEAKKGYSEAEDFAALDHIVKECKARNINLSTDHETNIKIGWALHSIGADSSYFHSITDQSPDYLFDEMEDRFNSLSGSLDTNRCGFGALVNIAKEAGITVPLKTIVAAAGNKLTVNNTPRKVTQMDIRDAVKQRYTVYLDEGSSTYYYAPIGTTDPFLFTAFTAKSTFLNKLLGELETVGIFISKSKLEETLLNEHTYTIINYLTMQLDWLADHYDKQDHFAKLLTCINTGEDALFAYSLKKWMVNLVAQIYQDGEKSIHETVFVLVGDQNEGKTGFFKSLLWSDKWFTAPINYDFQNKEHLLMMNSRALILLDEMAAYGKADVRQMKGALSSPKVSADKKFCDTADYIRNASFCGCSNNTDFLKDDTGDRRFLVFNINSPVVWDIYNSVDKMQLWGQMVKLFKSKFDYKFSNEEVKERIQHNMAAFTMHKPEDTFIVQCLDVTGESTDYLSNADLDVLLNDYKKVYNVREHLNISSIRAKLKMAGVKVGEARKIQGKTVKGFTGVRSVRNGGSF